MFALELQLLVLKYVQNKDVFMRYHKAHLTRRLILDSSADNEKEENMVEWLRVSLHCIRAGVTCGGPPHPHTHRMYLNPLWISLCDG